MNNTEFCTFYNDMLSLGSAGHEILKFDNNGNLRTGKKTIGFHFRWFTNIFRAKENRDTAEKHFGRMIEIFDQNKERFPETPALKQKFTNLISKASAKVRSLAERATSVAMAYGELFKIAEAKQTIENGKQELELERKKLEKNFTAKETLLSSQLQKERIDNQERENRSRERIEKFDKESQERIELLKANYQKELASKEAMLSKKLEGIETDHKNNLQIIQEAIKNKLEELAAIEKEQLSEVDRKIVSKQHELESLHQEYLRRELNFTILCPKEDGSGFDCIPTSTQILEPITDLSKIVVQWEKLKSSESSPPADQQQSQVPNSKIKVRYNDKIYDVEISTGKGYLVAEYNRDAVEWFLKLANQHFYVDQVQKLIPKLSGSLVNWHHHVLDEIDSLESFLELYKMANFFNAEFAKKLLCEKIKPQINFVTALKVAVTLQFHKDDPVMKLSYGMVASRFTGICETDKEGLLNRLSHPSLIELLQLKDFVVESQANLLRTVLNWAKKYVDQCIEPKPSIQAVFYLKVNDKAIKDLILFENIPANDFMSLQKEHSFLKEKYYSYCLERQLAGIDKKSRPSRGLTFDEDISPISESFSNGYGISFTKINYKITNIALFKEALKNPETRLPNFEFEGNYYQLSIVNKDSRFKYILKSSDSAPELRSRLYIDDIDNIKLIKSTNFSESGARPKPNDFSEIEAVLKDKKEITISLHISKAR